MSDEALCRVDDIPDNGSIGFNGPHEGQLKALMAIRQGGKVFVYVNSCPHIGAPLDFEPGRFLDLEREHILCANHGALFRIEDGACLLGPCKNKGLEPVAVEIRDGKVFAIP